MNSRTKRLDWLHQTMSRRIVLLDGAFGTMAQSLGLDEDAFRGQRFKDVEQDLRGNIDVLCLTQPHAIAHIHRQYLAAGADILTTNSFTANGPSQADYGLEHLVFEMNRSAAALARAEADRWTGKTDEPRLVAGQYGPHQPHTVHVAKGRRPRLPGNHVRRTEQHVLRGGKRPVPGRRRSVAAGNDFRYVERESGSVRNRPA